MLKLAIGTPAYRGEIASSQMLMYMQLGAALARLKDKGEMEPVMISNVDVCGVERARNLLVAYAMKSGADWLLMIDSDTWAEQGSELARMILEAPECAMVGAAVRTRGHPGLNVYRWDQNDRKHFQIGLSSSLQNRGIPNYQEVDAIGGAIIALNLLRIGSLDFRWLYREDGTTMSEDLYFCRRLREHNQRIFVDVRVRTLHTDKPGVLSSTPGDGRDLVRERA